MQPTTPVKMKTFRRSEGPKPGTELMRHYDEPDYIRSYRLKDDSIVAVPISPQISPLSRDKKIFFDTSIEIEGHLTDMPDDETEHRDSLKPLKRRRRAQSFINYVYKRTSTWYDRSGSAHRQRTTSRTSDKVKTRFRATATGKPAAVLSNTHFTCRKAVVVTVFTVALGFSLWFAIRYGVPYDVTTTLAITCPSTAVLWFGLMFSRRIRCMLALSLPVLATMNGRAILLSTLTAWLLMNPGTNIAKNASRISESMGHAVQYMSNNTDALQAELVSVFGGLQYRYAKLMTNLIETVVERTIASIPRHFNCISNVDQNTGETKWQVCLDDLQNFAFKFLVIADIHPVLEFTKSPENITAEIRAAFAAQLDVVEMMAKYITLAMKGSVLLVLLLCWIYYHAYLTVDSFDNWFITDKFVFYDRMRKEHGLISVLPLTVNERHKYIFANSICLNRRERLSVCFGMVIFIGYFLMGLFLILVDYGLYWTMILIRDTADTTVTVGRHTGMLTLLGNFTSDLDTFFNMSFVNESLTLNSSFRSGDFLPDPLEPSIYSQTAIVVVVSIYVTVLVLTLLNAFILRFQHKLAGMFFPERELYRVLYLYNRLLNERHTFLEILIAKLKYRRSKLARHNNDLGDRLWMKFPECCAFFQAIGIVSRYCTICGDKDNHSFTEFDDGSVYCNKCICKAATSTSTAIDVFISVADTQTNPDE